MLQKFQKANFNCFTISDLQVIVHNNNSDVFCVIDDSHDFSGQFLFYHDLIGRCSEIMIPRRKNVPIKSQQTQSRVCENLI